MGFALSYCTVARFCGKPPGGGCCPPAPVAGTGRTVYMAVEPECAMPPSKTLLWTGRILSALPILLLIGSASMKLSQQEAAVKGFAELGFPDGLVLPLGIVEISCVVLYLVPQTSVLGAILATGYLGGAVATHVHAGQAFVAPVIAGMLLWAGLALREPRLRALLPLRSMG